MVDISTPEKRFDIVNSYIGLGEPNNSLWFIGLEEAGGWKECWIDDRDDYEAYSKHIKQRAEKDVEPISRAYAWISKICTKLILHNDMEWSVFRKKHLFKKDCPVFQSNLYPLGKPSRQDYPDHYKSVFGYSLDEYNNLKHEKRWKNIKDYGDKSSPQATICFGQEGWNSFLNMLEISKSPSRKLNNGKIHIFENDRVILTHFFRNNSGGEILETIVPILNSWNVSLRV